MTQPPSTPFALPEIVVAVKRRWPLGAIAAGIAFAAVLFLAFRGVPLYEANATLTINRERKPVEFQVDRDSGVVQDSLINTYRELLLARDVLEQTIPLAGLLSNPVYAGSSEPVEVLQSRVSARTVRSTWVIEITMRDEDPKVAESALQVLLDVYLAKQARLSQSRGDQALRFLSDQVEEANDRLATMRANESAFRAKRGILSADPDRNVHTQRLEDLARRQVDLEQKIEAQRSLVARLDAAGKESDRARRQAIMLEIPEIGQSDLVMIVRAMILKFEGEERMLAEKYKDKHPRMVELRGHLSAKRQQLSDAVTSASDGIRARERDLLAQAVALGNEIDAAKQTLAAYREALLELRTMEQDRATQEKLADQLTKRLGEETITTRLEVPDLAVTMVPKVRSEPATARKAPFFALAAVLGSVVFAATCVAVDLLDRRLTGAAAAARLTGLPVLGSLPQVRALPSLIDEQTLTTGTLAESVRHLRTALRLALGAAHECRIIAVCSSAPGEGKSTVTTLLAASLAAAGSRVLLVDGDLRQPRLHELVGMTPIPGFTDLLGGSEEVAPIPTGLSNLDFLGSGAVANNPTELLHSHCLPEWIAVCREHYDFVLIDTPPIANAPDALLLGYYADSLLVVVRERITEEDVLADALVRLKPLATHLLGVVVNGDHQSVPGYRYEAAPAGRPADVGAA
jgi:polysaccharide biosynthesis transport protein